MIISGFFPCVACGCFQRIEYVFEGTPILLLDKFKSGLSVCDIFDRIQGIESYRKKGMEQSC